MTDHDPWFFEERAVAFAKLVLTEHDNVRVQSPTGPDTAADLLVEVLKGGKSTLRFFGVQLIPYLDLPASSELDERVLAHLSKDASRTALPLCVFVIGVRKPEGVYRWLVEPVVADGQALLHRAGPAGWQTLDAAAVAHLIGQVNAWYDALNGGPPPKTRGRSSKTTS